MKKFFVFAFLFFSYTTWVISDEDQFLEEHSIKDKPTHVHKNPNEGLNDYEKSPNAHNYFDDSNWPENREGLK